MSGIGLRIVERRILEVLKSLRSAGELRRRHRGPECGGARSTGQFMEKESSIRTCADTGGGTFGRELACRDVEV